MVWRLQLSQGQAFGCPLLTPVLLLLLLPQTTTSDKLAKAEQERQRLKLHKPNQRSFLLLLQATTSGKLAKLEEERQFLKQLNDTLLANQRDFQVCFDRQVIYGLMVAGWMISNTCLANQRDFQVRFSTFSLFFQL